MATDKKKYIRDWFKRWCATNPAFQAEVKRRAQEIINDPVKLAAWKAERTQRVH